MPNQPKTPVHSFRIPDRLWDRMKAKAAREERSVSDVMIEILENALDGDIRDTD